MTNLFSCFDSDLVCKAIQKIMHFLNCPIHQLKNSHCIAVVILKTPNLCIQKYGSLPGDIHVNPGGLVFRELLALFALGWKYVLPINKLFIEQHKC